MRGSVQRFVPSAIPRLALIALLLAAVFPAPAYSAGPASRPRLVLYALGNETGNPVYDSACAGAERSLAFTLRQMGTYELESQARPIGKSEGELRAAAMERSADYLVYGGIGAERGKNLVFRLGLFDRAKGRTTVLKESEPVPSLGLFEAMDAVIAELLDGISGGHIAFGSVTLTNTGEKGTYRVIMDGMDAGDDLVELPRVLVGTHSLSIVQRRMLGNVEVGRATVTLKESEGCEVSFAVPYLTAEEKARLDNAERSIRAEWESPLIAAQTAAKVAAYSALLHDISYSPRLAVYQGRARQLEAEWAVIRNRFEIEEGVWRPESSLLHPSMVVYLTAKQYPDPDVLRKGAESNASLLATLHELAAGEAMAAGRYEEGVKLLEAILDFTLYLPSQRKTEYAFAVSTVKQLVSSREANEIKFKENLEAVFGAQMKAGAKLRSLESRARQDGATLLLSSDTSTEFVVGATSREFAPVLVKPVDGRLLVRVSGDSEGTQVELGVPVGRKVAFLEGGFSTFGRARSGGSVADMAVVKFKCVPRGYTVYANGEAVGTTPIDQLTVYPGSVVLRFERQGEKPKEMQVRAKTGTVTSVVWGTLPEHPIELERRTIPLTAAGEAAAWEGIEPILEGNFPHAAPPLSNPAYAMTRVFMCRDENHLYSRVDFAERNPLGKPPDDVGSRIGLQFSLVYEPARMLKRSLIVKPDDPSERVDGWKELWDIKTQKGQRGTRFPPAFWFGPTTVVQKMPLSDFDKYRKDPVAVFFTLANSDAKDGWSIGSVNTLPRYIDLSD